MTVEIEHCPLLFHAEPGLIFRHFFHCSWAGVSVVRVSWRTVVVENWREDEYVRGATEGIWENAHWSKISLGAVQTGETYFNKQSELRPSAWPVDEPSKFHSGSSSIVFGTESRVRLLERRCSPVPSIQTYIAWHFPPQSSFKYLSRALQRSIFWKKKRKNYLSIRHFVCLLWRFMITDTKNFVHRKTWHVLEIVENMKFFFSDFF